MTQEEFDALVPGDVIRWCKGLDSKTVAGRRGRIVLLNGKYNASDPVQWDIVSKTARPEPEYGPGIPKWLTREEIAALKPGDIVKKQEHPQMVVQPRKLEDPPDRKYARYFNPINPNHEYIHDMAYGNWELIRRGPETVKPDAKLDEKLEAFAKQPAPPSAETPPDPGDSLTGIESLAARRVVLAAREMGEQELARPVLLEMEKRQKLGKAKYGTQLSDNPALYHERLQHAYEEALDMISYLEWADQETVEQGDRKVLQQFQYWGITAAINLAGLIRREVGNPEDPEPSEEQP
jgi:hypothetical protein